MQQLNLPKFEFRIKSNENKTLIFDRLRKKYIVLTPEEWVRQNFVQYLIDCKKYPSTLIAIEKQLLVNGLKKRTDIIIFNRDGATDILIECKAPSVTLSQNTFDQIARYNLKLNAKFLIVTNGLQHVCCMLNKKEENYTFLEEIPAYKI
ncbi:type I restriction enzyme HsdR N-terminal domain-containing protein [Tenacibaculum sp. SG-28]|uniref:type I restriction enzyme HsdR N-terminal domain-containing protein n=1 Tax=Tenacibaculum sp. SG-28 TaxID=754426 RepID=UPI000CF42324|nr:type I restriction enzyme HsdR N-terminal domain-containing protein [Tenacibaculum sp. SG-28]PQJ20764.1 restriction endonuclease subunit R [Tenacibaculum sp. SG-28]